MNDHDIKNLLKSDNSAPKVPKNELNQIHQRIEDSSFDIFRVFNFKSIALACCLVIVVAGVKFSITNLSTPRLTEQEQQELIEFMLEDQYLSNTESSYAWIEDNN